MTKGKIMEANVVADYDFDNDEYRFELKLSRGDTIKFEMSELDMTAFMYIFGHILYEKNKVLAQQEEYNKNAR